MLSKISWTQYFYAVALILAVYYAYVILRYYSLDIQEKFTQKRPYVPEVEEQEEHHEVQQEQITAKSTDSTDDSFDQIESLIEQVKIHIEGEGKSVIVNENFASELEQIIKSYPSLKYTPYKSAINELIITECGKYGLNTLDEEDVSKFWE